VSVSRHRASERARIQPCEPESLGARCRCALAMRHNHLSLICYACRHSSFIVIKEADRRDRMNASMCPGEEVKRLHTIVGTEQTKPSGASNRVSVGVRDYVHACRLAGRERVALRVIFTIRLPETDRTNCHDPGNNRPHEKGACVHD
jgi:hypothetical protein